MAGSNNWGSHYNWASAVPDPIIASGPHQSYLWYLEPQSVSPQTLEILSFLIILQNVIPVSYSPVGYVSLRAEVLTCLLYTTLYQIHWVGAQVGSIILLKMVFPNTALISVLFYWKGEKQSAHNHLERNFPATYATIKWNPCLLLIYC